MKKLLSKVKRAVGSSESTGRSQISTGLSNPISRGNVTKIQKRTVWNISKRFLSTARDGADLFLPLKTVLVGVVALMDVVDVSLLLYLFSRCTVHKRN